MPEIAMQSGCASLTDLVECESFGEPVGAPSRQIDSGFFCRRRPDRGSTWECAPGVMNLDLDITEFCHLLEGPRVLTSESGQVTELKAGDTGCSRRAGRGSPVWPAETVRKVYLIISPELLPVSIAREKMPAPPVAFGGRPTSIGGPLATPSQRPVQRERAHEPRASGSGSDPAPCSGHGVLVFGQMGYYAQAQLFGPVMARYGLTKLPRVSS